MITISNTFASSNRNLGNKLFTYSISSIIANTYDYKLELPENSHIQRNGIISDFPYKTIDGVIVTEPEYYISDSDIYNKSFEVVLKECKNKKILVDGYFLKYDYIKNHKEFVKNLYANLTEEPDNKNDVIILLRDSNCDSTFKLPDEYYLNILKEIKFENLYVSYDHFNKHQSIINSLSEYNPILLDLPILDLLKFITTKNTIIGCQGTYSFWACFLSKSTKIYWPITKKGPNSFDWSVNLTVDDEERYKFINVE